MNKINAHEQPWSIWQLVIISAVEINNYEYISIVKSDAELKLRPVLADARSLNKGSILLINFN